MWTLIWVCFILSVSFSFGGVFATGVFVAGEFNSKKNNRLGFVLFGAGALCFALYIIFGLIYFK